MQWAQMCPPGGGRPRWVKCSPQFNVLVGNYYPDPISGRDAASALLSIFKKCIPMPSSIFAGQASLRHLIHLNDYVLDKSFVYGAIMLGKWLGRDRLPAGVFGFWPPDPPPGAIPDAFAGDDAIDDVGPE